MASSGRAKAAMSTLRPNPAMSHAPVVVPTLAPKTTPTPAASGIRPADRNEIVMIDTSVEDCITEVDRNPNVIARGREPVARSATARGTHR